MKLETDKTILQFFAMSLVMILLGAFMVVFFQVKQVQMFGAGIILGGVMLTIMALYTSIKPKDHFLQDERSVRIYEKAGCHALWIMLGMGSFIQLVDLFWKLNLQYKDVAPILFVIGLYSWFILKWYYNRRSMI